MRGKLFLVKSTINLKHDLLDTPEYFWESPEVESFYINMRKYLEIDNRVEVLNAKLQVISELLEMLADELAHKHSSLLEWIIILLIAFEIVVFGLHDIFKLF